MSLETRIERRKAGFFAISLSGRLDAETAQACEFEVGPTLAEKPTMLMLELSQLNYISSIGIRLVLKIRKAVEAAGGELVMVNAQPQIKKVFEIVAVFPAEAMLANVVEADRYFERIQKLWK